MMLIDLDECAGAGEAKRLLGTPERYVHFLRLVFRQENFPLSLRGARLRRSNLSQRLPHTGNPDAMMPRTQGTLPDAAGHQDQHKPTFMLRALFSAKKPPHCHCEQRGCDEAISVSGYDTEETQAR